MLAKQSAGQNTFLSQTWGNFMHSCLLVSFFFFVVSLSPTYSCFYHSAVGATALSFDGMFRFNGGSTKRDIPMLFSVPNGFSAAFRVQVCCVVLCCVVLCCVVFCFVLFCFVLFCVVLCCVLFCFVLFCFVLFCFVLFCFVLFCFDLLFTFLKSGDVRFCVEWPSAPARPTKLF